MEREKEGVEHAQFLSSKYPMRSHHASPGKRGVRGRERGQDAALGNFLPMDTTALPRLCCRLLPGSSVAAGALKEPEGAQ